MSEILRLTAFPLDPADPAGGNPAGLVLDARGWSDDRMQRTAAEVGYAETAFLVSPPGQEQPRRLGIRYFSPVDEVPFCGHATIATAVVLAEQHGLGTFVFSTPVGDLDITTEREDGRIVAAFTSIEPRISLIEAGVLTRLLALLDVSEGDLDPQYPPRSAFAGNVHPILVFAERSVFDRFGFDSAAVRSMMVEQGWTGTVTTAIALDRREFEARNLFPVGTLTEDPATGSAAAAFGGYLRELGLIDTPARIAIRQGRHVGRPSLLLADVPVTGGITVSGTAARIG